MLFICAILLPIVDIIKDNGLILDADDYIGEIEEYQSDTAVKWAFEDGICEYIASEYRVDRSEVTVTADGFDLSTLRAQRIYVTLSGRAALLDYKEIESEIALKFTGGGECEVSVKVG